MSILDSSRLAPGYLVAAPNLQDPNFAETIILMAEHGQDGAIGFIINRTTSITLDDLLQSVDVELAELARERGLSDKEVLVGGPVQRNIAWVLYRRSDGDDIDEDDIIAVCDDLVLGASVEVLRALISRNDSGPFHVFLGYSGWGVQQLEHEIGFGSWLPLDFEGDLTFEVPLQERWDAAIKRLGLIPGGFMMGGPGASA
ncbi:MAG: YqgE/AlgH family protein [Myxococcota bacterium]